MRPELTVLRGDEGFYNPSVRVRFILRPTVDVAFTETDAHHFARRIAQDKSARKIFRPFVAPPDEGEGAYRKKRPRLFQKQR